MAISSSWSNQVRCCILSLQDGFLARFFKSAVLLYIFLVDSKLRAGYYWLVCTSKCQFVPCPIMVLYKGYCAPISRADVQQQWGPLQPLCWNIRGWMTPQTVAILCIRIKGKFIMFDRQRVNSEECWTARCELVQSVSCGHFVLPLNVRGKFRASVSDTWLLTDWHCKSAEISLYWPQNQIRASVSNHHHSPYYQNVVEQCWNQTRLNTSKEINQMAFHSTHDTIYIKKEQLWNRSTNEQRKACLMIYLCKLGKLEIIIS